MESRAATEKYKRVKVGDELVFVCGKSRLERKVKNVKVFRSIDSMLRTIPRRSIMPSTLNIAEMKRAYHSYSGYKEKIKKHGLIAFCI